jgi:hypothetical protein
MTDYKVQVKLPNGQVSDFEAFVVNHPTNGFSKEFNDLELAEVYIQQIDQELLKNFMINNHCLVGNSNSNQSKIIDTFISWYANLDVFDKTKFIKLLQKVHKIDE